MLSLSIDAAGETHAGDALETTLSPQGIRLEVDFGPRMGVLPIGGELLCRVRDSRSDSSLELPARLLHQTRSGGRVRCGLDFDLESPQLLFLLNQRRALRVSPSPALPVTVRLPSGTQAVVNDLSTSGMSLRISEEAQHQLTDWKLQLALRLPNVDEELPVTCRVRGRKLQGETIQVGLEFDPRAPGLENLVPRIEEYVRQRQRELLEESARRHGA